MHRAYLPLSLILALVAGSPVHAQTSSQSLLRLKPDHTVRVETKDALRIEGKLLAATAESIAIQPESSKITIATAQIARVYERKHSAGTGALVGLIVGAAVGVAGGIAASQS